MADVMRISGETSLFADISGLASLAILIIFFSNFLLKTVNTAVRNYADTLVDNAVSDLNTAIVKGDSEAYSKSVVGNDGAGGLMRLR